MELPSQNPNLEQGSWHPAMRPDSHSSSYVDQQQDEKNAQNPHLLGNGRSSPLPRSDASASKAGPGSVPPSANLSPTALISSEQPRSSDVPRLDMAQDEYRLLRNAEVKNNRSEEKLGMKSGDEGIFDEILETNRHSDVSFAPHYQHSEYMDDIQFPEYAPFTDKEAEQPAGPSEVHPANKPDSRDREQPSNTWGTQQYDRGLDGGSFLNRTNSFPAVPPLNGASTLPPRALPHSHVEYIMDDGNNEEYETINADSQFTSLERNEDSSVEYYSSKVDGKRGSLPNSITNGEDNARLPATPADEEARFEEGLPLVSSKTFEDELHGDVNHANGKIISSPNWNSADDGNFFSKDLSSSQDSSLFQSQPLDRKSTMQVLDSMHYESNGTVSKELRSSLDYASMTQGEDDTVDLHEKKLENIPGTSSSINDSQEVDLAALWEAELGDDELLEDDETGLDSSTFFKDDGEGFLQDQDQNQTIGEELSQQSLSSGLQPPASDQVRSSDVSGHPVSYLHPKGEAPHNSNLPPSAQLQTKSSSGYFPQGLTATAQTLEQPRLGVSHSFSASSGFSNPSTQNSYPSKGMISSRPQMPEPAQSFSDKSKGGYTSPYDLPIDVSRPKKRPHFQQMQSALSSQNLPKAPPPRSSSINSAGSSPVVDNHPPISNLPSANSLSGFDSRASLSNVTAPILTTKPSTVNFFEELPSTKPRPSSSRGKPISSTTQRNQFSSAPFNPNPNPSQQAPPQQRPNLSSSNTAPGYQLLPPERMGPYSNVPQQNSTRPNPNNSRYSPAPMPGHNVAPARNRYASSQSGAARPPPPSQSVSFQPRTSSPLAQSNTISQHYQRNSASDIPPNNNYHQEHTASHNDSDKYASHEDGEPKPETRKAASSHPSTNRSPSKPPYVPQIPMIQPNNTQRHEIVGVQRNQENIMTPISEAPLRPPQRSQTQSPGTARSKQHLPLNAAEPYQRPASVNHQVAVSHVTPPDATASHRTGQRTKSFSRNISYITPTDGREYDPLGRWRGCPILSFGFGGTIVTSFPKQIPRYSGGQTAPMIKCSPGEVKISIGKTLTSEESFAAFPGPLRSKTKKKDVLEWLQKRITQLESSYVPVSFEPTLPSLQVRHEEKILLWRVLKLLVENDGFIEGNTTALTATSFLLLPELASGNSVHQFSNNSEQDLTGISKYDKSNKGLEPANSESLESIRKLLLQGKREDAVWFAVDQRLWDHAMLLSSTLEPKIWKQVLQEFIRQEVKTFGRNSEALASLYQIFAGNHEESVDELVPPSARAGLQMVSKAPAVGPTKNALAGLDRWRETLALILSNRTQDDGKALVALGRLLSNYGRIEAAHICYMFAKSPGLFGGADDPHVGVALLGADHVQHPFDYCRNLDSILLTEVYDFATTVLVSSTVTAVFPHMQSYKLYHATLLAECGQRSEAQQYCEAISVALKSTTKLSPYYHSLLFGALEDLVERLRQAPKDGSASWMSKPSMDKVSGSVWAKFNQFIAGDESDSGSIASNKGFDHDTAGPFAGVARDSPSISRMPSSNELYSGYPVGGDNTNIAPTSTASNSRYTPADQYTPRSSLEHARGWSSQEKRRQSDGEGLRPHLPYQQYQPRHNSSTEILQDSPPSAHNQSPQPSAYSQPAQSYLPTPSSQPQHMPIAPPEEVSSSLYDDDSYRPEPPPKDEVLTQSNSGYNESSTGPASSFGYEPPSSLYEPPTINSYDPPSSNHNTYNPPSYDPGTIDDAESPPQEKPKKKSFMDDDDDDAFEARAAAVRKAEKAQKDREADEAFKKAAEADGKSRFKIMCLANFNTADLY